MTERRKKILSLALTATLIFSVTGCKRNNLKVNLNEKTRQEKLVGGINLEALKNCYLVEITNLNDKTGLYLTYANYNWDGGNKDIDLEILGTNIEIASTFEARGKYVSKYGKVEKIYPFSYFLFSYGEVKQSYTSDEIEEIFNKIKKDYDNLKTKEEVKKLDLKK